MRNPWKIVGHLMDHHEVLWAPSNASKSYPQDNDYRL